MKLSIVICTYNRAIILEECLQSLADQTADHSLYEVIIVNNKSTDNTQEIINQFVLKNSNFRASFEDKVGLSHARNKGFMDAKYDWIVYLDDDAKASSNYVERALWIIDQFDFDCFGGMFYAWHFYGKPKWLSEKFGSKTSLRPDTGQIDGTTGLLTGNNFAVKKKLLEKLGGFDPNFGMTGENVKYGEEDHLQKKLLEMNYKIGFDPELTIEHAVLPHKLKLSWHLISSYQHGQTKEQLIKNKRSLAIPFFELIKSTAGLFFKRFPLGIYKILTTKNYYWQNLLLDAVQSVLYHYGSFIWNLKSRINAKG